MVEMKFDAALTGLLGSARLTPQAKQPMLDIFVRCAGAPTPKQVEELKILGLVMADAPQAMFSARVPANVIRQIAEKPWIRRLGLARQLVARAH